MAQSKQEKTLEVNGKRVRPSAVIPAFDREPGDKVAWTYCRVSTLDQDTTCSAQIKTARTAYELVIKARGLRYGGEFIDPAVSGKVPVEKRDAGGMMFKMLQRGDLIIVPKLDRFGRSLIDFAVKLEECLDMGVNIYACDLGADSSTDMGRFVLRIAASIAEWERERMSSRQLESVAARRAAGMATNGVPPRGFTLVKSAAIGGREYFSEVPCLLEQAVMRRFYEWVMIAEVTPADVHLHCNKYRIKRLRASNRERKVKELPAEWTPDSIYRWLDDWTAIVGTERDITLSISEEELNAVLAEQNPGFLITPFRRYPRKGSLSKARSRRHYLASKNSAELPARATDAG